MWASIKSTDYEMSVLALHVITQIGCGVVGVDFAGLLTCVLDELVPHALFSFFARIED